MAEKVTIMVLKVVDLQCSRSYTKIKKILCKFPEIRDQEYDEKANTVTIKVVCCDPEKLRDKLCCKGRKVIISIKIEPEPEPDTKPKPNPNPNPDSKPKPDPNPNPDSKPKTDPNPDPEPKPKPNKPTEPKEVVVIVVEQSKPSEPPPKPEPVMFPVLMPLYPVPTFCSQCYGGHDGGPCQRGHGVPQPPRPCFEGYYYGCRCGRDCRDFSRCGCYLSEENHPSSCSVM